VRIRDSGMPDEAYWESLFDVPLTLERLGMGRLHDVAELGCGYGTFSIPIAQAISGTLWTFDIDPRMVQRTRERAAGLRIDCQVRDVMVEGFGVADMDAVLVFNILHCDDPVSLLRHAARAARPGGLVHVTHWQHRETPRGPNLKIRPQPEQIAQWAGQVGLVSGPPIDLPPWHFGLILRLTA
jgi:SAM-dependent methyltransferase